MPAVMPVLLSKVQAADHDSFVLGTLEFSTSAEGEAQEKFVAGVKALHSFWYEQARELFQEAQALDPAFGMAYWGEAMSFDNALGTVFDTDYENFGLLGEDPGETLPFLVDNRPLFLGVGAPRGAWLGLRYRF